MTYRDPNDSDREMSYRDSTLGRTYSDPARPRTGNSATTIVALVVIVLIAAAIAFATSTGPTTTATGPYPTQSTPRLAKEGQRVSSQASIQNSAGVTPSSSSL